MRNLFLALGLVLAGCATTAKDDTKNKADIFGKNLAAGECGLYVWTADTAKRFTLFASPREINFFDNGDAISLIEVDPSTRLAGSREFLNPEGKTLQLTLLSPQDFDGGTRYKAGRLTSLSEDGWEKVVPIVGLYACQPPI